MGSSGCVPLVCLNRGPGTEMSSLETESQGGSKSREPEQSAGWSQVRVKPGLASQKPMKEMGIRQKEQRMQMEDSGEKSESSIRMYGREKPQHLPVFSGHCVDRAQVCTLHWESMLRIFSTGSKCLKVLLGGLYTPTTSFLPFPIWHAHTPEPVL